VADVDTIKHALLRKLPMLTCRDFINFIVDYLSNELSQSEREKFEFHLADCPHCAKYLASYQTTITFGRLTFSDLDGGVSDEVPEELVQAILKARSQGTTGRKTP
jgi:anti-sigma factor RsiW